VHFRKRPLLTEKHREKRLRFALENHGEEWDDVILIYLYGQKILLVWTRGSPSVEETPRGGNLWIRSHGEDQIYGVGRNLERGEDGTFHRGGFH
jgi:hypothetical protein